MITRPFEDRDVEPVLAIQRESPEIAQWTPRDYARVAAGEMTGWVAEDGTTVVGFLVARSIGDEIEILNLAVRRDSRRLGIGASLLRAARNWGRTLRACKAFLEVRASNLVAINFYERHGFRTTGRRPHYYTAPTEDALLLTSELAELA